jgi:hypothetical protein
MNNKIDISQFNTLIQCPLKFKLTVGENLPAQINSFLDEIWISFFKSGKSVAKLIAQRVCLIQSTEVDIKPSVLYNQICSILDQLGEPIFRGKLLSEVGKFKTCLTGDIDLSCTREDNSKRLTLFSNSPTRIDSYEILGSLYLIETIYSRKIDSIVYLENVVPLEGLIFKSIPVNDHWLRLSKQVIEASVDLFNNTKLNALPNLNHCNLCSLASKEKGNCLWSRLN